MMGLYSYAQTLAFPKIQFYGYFMFTVRWMF